MIRTALIFPLLATLAACAPRAASTPEPVAGKYIPFAVTNNRPEEVTVTVGTQRERFSGLEKRTMLVKTSGLSEGCASVLVRTQMREEWASQRFCNIRKMNVLVGGQLAMSSVTAAP